ncbi:MAG TPA: hypothetical protein VHN20_12995, partial [Beijerinckiaceae bacterium]|nr:hypothetical protein [Beijerinckiaceae bacterium]
MRDDIAVQWSAFTMRQSIRGARHAFVSTFSGESTMMRTTLVTLVIAGSIGGSLGLQPSATQAADAGATTRRQLDCWIGAKFG